MRAARTSNAGVFAIGSGTGLMNSLVPDFEGQRLKFGHDRPPCLGGSRRYSAATVLPPVGMSTAPGTARPHGPTQERVHLRWKNIRLPSTTAENAA